MILNAILCSRLTQLNTKIWHSKEIITSSSPGLAGRLVEPSSHIVLPVLPEVPTGNNIVVLHGLPRWHK